MIWCWMFSRRLSIFFPMAWMCLIWFNMHLFSCTLLHFPVSFWLEMDSKTCWTFVGSFLTIMRIQTLVLFLYGNELFYGLLFVDWWIYDTLWCSWYFVKIPIGAPLGGKLTLASNISSLMKGLSERSIFKVWRVEVFLTNISSEPGDHHLPNLFLCSSNFVDEQYLSFLVCVGPTISL